MSFQVRSQLGLAERLGVKALDDCGPASLATAASGVLGTAVTTKQGWEACKLAGRIDMPDRAEGTSAKQLRDAAKHLGVSARSVYEWPAASTATKAGAFLILNIQASASVLPLELRSAWQARDWKRRPSNAYGHWVVLAHDGEGWLYGCPTMAEGESMRRITPEQVRALRDSKQAAGFPPPPAMIIITKGV